MKEFLEVLIIPVTGLITYLLGHVTGRKKVKAEIKKLELANLHDVVDFYKTAITDLKDKVNELSVEIDILREENKALRNNIHELNRQLSKNQNAEN